MGTVLWNGAVSALVIGLGAGLVLRWGAVCGLAPWRGWQIRPYPAEGETAPSRQRLGQVFALALLFRLLVFLAGSLAYCAGKGQLSLEGLLACWVRWDAQHYVKLAELGYSGYIEDGQHLFLVFFPLYVWLTRLVKVLVGNTVLAGLLVSWLCFGGGCLYTYRLVSLDYGEETAKRTLLLLSVFPYAFFFGGVMTESLFFLTVAAALWHIRRHEWRRAGLWGLLSALTRMHGLLLMGAALAEYGQHCGLFAPGRDWKEKLCHFLRTLPAILLPVLGTAGYLLLNWWVDGDPFSFTVQQAHWSQGFLWISQVLAYLVQNALSYPSLSVRLELWIPEVLLFAAFFALMWQARGRHRGMYTLYAFVTLVLDYSLSWLLSAGRYLSCALPFFWFAACLLGKRPRLTAALAGVMAALFALNLVGYFNWAQIM
ncbi:glycosyltransferase family 39 protein [Pseudoflavonifractor phocaeensis]|uniref:mannosyltransferase family protein n=1 Tax=Pseudoflavonifractor phocaeensis TaxID=1870988 RepID=UPI0019588473|nr:mannosyltransferase family protein [Pseudoflavonifractor phocaeensis]MBM6869570.1 glycosyltransferase family 39 protein [Pseudoflavonifractor phocaeensis]MBM6938574.1 glycosyltransferase family 39 protein [Pseudoflavonifractor phocaeensis]